MSVRKGPQLDRWLMRIKDACLIIGFLWAVFKFIYIRPLEMQAEIDKVLATLNIQAQEMKDINGKLSRLGVK
jgi:hypothetical protein